MANTTFSGAVRSENGFEVVSKNATTGAFTTSFTYDGSGMQVAPVTLSDADASLTAATHGGRVLVVPALTSNRTLTLPSPSEGVSFKFIYGGAAEETENLIIDTGADGNSNSILTLTDFGLMEINIVAKDSTNWIIWGNTEGADAPAFTDQS